MLKMETGSVRILSAPPLKPLIFSWFVIKNLTKHHCKEYKEIRLDALKKSPDSFLSSFEEENKISDINFVKDYAKKNHIKHLYLIPIP